MAFGKDQDPRTNVKYSDEMAHSICRDIRLGLGIVKTCEKHDIDITTFFYWKRNNAAFSSLLSQAREDQMFVMVDEIQNIADDGTNDWIEGKNGETRLNNEAVQRSRLRIESRKWLATVFASKDFAPKQNSEGSENTLTIKVENNIDG